MKHVGETYNLIEDMALNHYQWSNERGNPQKVPEEYNVDALNLT